MSCYRDVTLLILAWAIVAADDKPLSPVEARTRVGETTTVEMTVRAAKDRLEKRGEIYLDSEPDFQSAKNFAVVISRAGAASLKEAGIAQPAEHFKNKPIRATGKVTEVDKVPRIVIDDASQIAVVAAQPKAVVRMAVVITPESSGLLQQLLAEFEKQSGLKVAVDSRQDVFGMARDGKADLVLAHYGHGGTEAFCMEGFGLWPRPVFANQAALIGPASDPAHIAGARDAVEAYRRIAEAKAAFVVNNAATEKYLADLLWQAAGQPDRTGWYRDKGLRNQAATKDAIEAAVKEQGYTLWGLVPFLKYQEEHPDCGMKALVTDDPLFHRIMVTVVVRPEKISGVNAEGARALERFLVAPETQARIRAFRVPGFAGQVWWPAGRNNSGAYLRELK